MVDKKQTDTSETALDPGQDNKSKTITPPWLHGRNESESVLLSRVQLFATSWTVALQALLSMEFSR